MRHRVSYRAPLVSKPRSRTYRAIFCACALLGCAHRATPPTRHEPVALGRALPDYASSGKRTGETAASIAEARASGLLPTPSNDVETVALPQLIAASVLNDPHIRAAFADVLRARATLTEESLFDNPNVSLSQTLTPFPGHAFTPTRQGGPPQLDVGINYALERILFGQRRAGILAAQHQIQADLAAYSNVARERTLEAIETYVDVLEAKELARLSREEVQQLERLEGITSRRVALGSVGQVELNRVHIAVIGGRRRELSARVDQENAFTRLRARLGPTYMRRTVDVPDSLDLAPKDPPPFEILLERALRSRPDVDEQARRVAAAHAAEERERRLALPKITFGLGYTRQFQERAIGFPNASSWGASLQSSLPIFDRNQGGIAAAGADVFEAEARLATLRLAVFAELEQALRSLKAAEEILASFDPDAMNAANSARNTIEEAYGLGGRTLLELLDAQQVYRDAYREHVLARAEYVRALHRLNAIVGEEVF